MTDILTIYGLCFVFTYLVPLIIFFRRLRIFPELKELKNLNSEPKYDKDRNVVSIETNFDAFSGDLGKEVHKTHVFSVLKRICTDVKDGRRYNPSVYLSLYKKYQYRFLGNVFLASHIAPIIVLFMTQFSLDNLFDVLLSLQFMWYVLIIVSQRFISGNYYLFTEIYYCNWYNKLLNFDALSINALKERLFKETVFVTPDEIGKMLNQMQDTFKGPFEMLLLSSEKLSSALEVFIGELQKYDLVTAESIIVSLEEKIKRFEFICEQLENSVLLTKEAHGYLSNHIENNKIDINAINGLANEFSNLRSTLAGYTNTAETAAIEKLSGVTSTLENNVNKTFATIEETLKANAVELSKSYDQFFEICKMLINNQEKKNV
jgi:hypothetical protein